MEKVCVTSYSSAILILGPEDLLSSQQSWVSGCGVPAGGSDDLCGSHSALLFSVQLLCLSQLLGVPFDLADLSISEMASQDVGSFSFSQHPLRNASPVLIHFLSLSFFLLFYPVMWRVSCPFWRFKFFC